MVDHERSPGAVTPIRILLADDHAVVRAGIRQFIERAGDLQVIAEAGDGETAKRLITETSPDVAVLDIQMPAATGIEVTRWVRTHHPRTGVLILTAYDDDPYVLAVLQAGANGYVLKTAAPDEIVDAVREVHAGKSALDAAIAHKLISRISDRPPASDYEALTHREAEVLTLAARGFTNKAIAVQLGISDRTVQGHLAKVFIKLQAASRTEAVMRAVSLGWISADLPG
ncbi:MAG TPA: response regulator transcription factor [Anaerolineales bacterium]|nr:response regulator transcription factor [Anaerolineales bacterium]